jgi:hypothetical protein
MKEEQGRGADRQPVERMTRELALIGEATQRAIERFTAMPMAAQHEVIEGLQERLDGLDHAGSEYRVLLSMFRAMAERSAAQRPTEEDVRRLPPSVQVLLEEKKGPGYWMVNRTRGAILEAIGDLGAEAYGAMIVEVLKARGVMTKHGRHVDHTHVHRSLEQMKEKGWIAMAEKKEGKARLVTLTDMGRYRLERWRSEQS